ncbi:APC family permease [Rhabdothermincola sediminis]|uniref:APC family permease n=1 Tax=Rhabdothermincola sediminis TaxID=2751370 RepID=UPI001AA01B22|nr:APC family permease [Rhabdothermincola sediminis]
MYSALKRLIVGPPIASTEEAHTRLGRPTALTVFASDAISSTAYATEEILLVLVPVVGMVALNSLVPISLVVALLLTIVITSYRQTIYAYPSGGGSYVVSRENLGVLPSLVAGASLLVDYILTVAVSVSAGIAAITSAFSELLPYRVTLCLIAIAVMTLANLRGAKESGKLFAPPVYTYIVSLALLIGYGLYEIFLRDLPPMEENVSSLVELARQHGTAIGSDGLPMFSSLGMLLLLRAFSSGAVALTGIEAISNGVPAFKKPESHNAATTLIAMGLILGTAFMGLSVVAHNLKPTVSEEETLLSIMGRYLYLDGPSSIGDLGNVLYYVLQFSTFAILILAANTAFADFPRVSSIIAGDGYLPRQLTNRGDRLVFSNGIILLALVAGILIVAFGGVTSALIPLYAVGVFTGFTLSQAGMVLHHRRVREKGWRRNQVINAVGALATFVVLLVVVVSKFAIGAWIPVLLIPIIVTMFRAIHRHYVRVATAISVPEGYRSKRHRHTVIVLVGQVHRGVLDAITYARSLAPDRLMAVTVVHDEEQQQRLQKQWEEYDIPVELRTIYSPYRELAGPVMAFIDELDREWPDDIITVVVPEFVLSHWWEQLLHNQSALVLRTRLRMRPNTVVTAVPIHLYERAEERY